MLTLRDSELAEIAGFIKDKYGVNLASKRTLIEGRIGSYVSSLGYSTFGEYFRYARNDPTGEEISNIINRLTTNHTYFMRGSDHFEFFVTDVLPWAESLGGDIDLRVWSAGCASGEEPYCLSIFILEYFAARGIDKASIDTTVLASDISKKALLTAANGVYRDDDLSTMPPAWVGKYFEDLGGGSYKVKPELRANVAFKNTNLLDPITAKKPYHAIMCRNVMIYFESETRNSLARKFYDALAPGGYLFIGHSESLTATPHSFEYIRPSVYRKPEF